MAERFEITAARRIERLERAQRDQATRHTSGYTTADAIGAALALPELRGFWPFSSVNEVGNIIDLSGQGRALTNAGVGRFLLNNMFAYGGFNGASSYLSRAHEAGLSITGGLTIGGWFRFDADGAQQGMISKSATPLSGYWMYRATNNAIAFGVGDGASFAQASSAVVAGGAWHFVVGRFYPSTNTAIFVDGAWTSNENGSPAAINANTTAFEVGRWITSLMNGGIALPFVCASVLSLALIDQYYRITRGLFGV